MVKLIAWVDNALSKSVILFMLAIIVTVSWQVFSRYVLHAPSSGSEEVARFFLIWIGLLGGVYCYRTHSHLGLDILVKRMSLTQQRNVRLLAHVMVFVFALVVLVIGGVNLVRLTLDPMQTSAVLGLSIGIVYSIIPLSGSLFCFYALIMFSDIFSQRELALGAR